MGAAGSTITLQHLSAVDIGKLVAGLGDNFAAYEASIVKDGVSGVVIYEMADADLKELLESIDIKNKVHLTVLCNHFKKLKGGNPAAPSGQTAVVQNVSNNADCCKFHALPENFEVGLHVTKTPRVIMNRLFEIQGIAVDPSEVEAAVTKLASTVGGGFGDGITKYDCFINYRVASDADLAEKLYLYLKNSGVHAFLDKKCLKNGEKWKEGFLTGLKNSKCFVALISRKALDKVRDKQADHTADNVLLEYETALNIMEVTGNKKYICPLHVGECNGGNLAKFQDFNPGLYPDSITAIKEATPAAPAPKPTTVAAKPATTAAPKPKPAAAPPRAPDDDDDPEGDEDDEGDEGDEGDDDEQEDRSRVAETRSHPQDAANEEAAITCPTCECNLVHHPAGTWHNGWSCDWPSHEGANSFSSADPVYGCPTIIGCNWGVCQACWNNYQAGQKRDDDNLKSIHVDQPEGTKSIYNDAYYCEVNKVQFKESGDDSYIITIVYYNVRGDMSLGPLEDPDTSRLTCGENDYYPEHKKVYFKDNYQNKGELIFHIPADEVEAFNSERVAFQFGDSAYTKARIIVPHSTYRECNIPRCSNGTHNMVVSDRDDGYGGGYACGICRQTKQGHRWFCEECQTCKCFSCEPIQVFYPKCPDGHELERVTGSKYGPRACDDCGRERLQYDPEFYHCKIDGYDLCLPCASEKQAEIQALL